MTTRSLALLVLVALLASCERTEEPAPGEEAGAPRRGTRERAALDVKHIVEGLAPGDVEGEERALVALRALREENRAGPGEVEPLKATARILIARSRFEEAARVHLEAAELLPPEDAALARVEAARALGAAGRPEEGLAMLEAMIRAGVVGPAQRVVPVERARVLLRLGRLEEGFAAYREEADRWSDTAPGRPIRLELARELLLRARDDEAEAVLDALWTSCPSVPTGQTAALRLAWLRARRGDPAAAGDILDRLDRLGEPDARERARALREGLALVGQPAPPLSGPLLDGGTLRAEDLAGRRVVVVFWDAEVQRSQIDLSRWALRAGRTPDLQVVGVPLGGRAEAVRAALARGSDGSAAVPQRFPAGDLARAWRVVRVPWTVVIARDGRVAGVDWPAGRTADFPE